MGKQLKKKTNKKNNYFIKKKNEIFNEPNGCSSLNGLLAMAKLTLR